MDLKYSYISDIRNKILGHKILLFTKMNFTLKVLSDKYKGDVVQTEFILHDDFENT